MDTNRAEFIDVRDKNDNYLNHLEQKLKINWEKIGELEKRVDDKLGILDKGSKDEQDQRLREREVKALVDDLTNQIGAQDENRKEKHLKNRLNDIEVRNVMADMLNKVSQNYMDSKFEDSIMEIVKSLQAYVGSANETSSAQY